MKMMISQWKGHLVILLKYQFWLKPAITKSSLNQSFEYYQYVTLVLSFQSFFLFKNKSKLMHQLEHSYDEGQDTSLFLLPVYKEYEDNQWEKQNQNF